MDERQTSIVISSTSGKSCTVCSDFLSLQRSHVHLLDRCEKLRDQLASLSVAIGKLRAEIEEVQKREGYYE